MSEPRKVKCCRVRACKWQGTEADYVFAPSKSFKDCGATDATCPRCGGKDFYRIKEGVVEDRVPDRYCDYCERGDVQNGHAHNCKNNPRFIDTL